MLGRLEKARDLAPLLLRLPLGAIMVFHGHGKVFGNMSGFAEGVAALGVPHWAVLPLAWAAALSEFVGGIFLVLGLLTRWAALLVAVTMGVATFSVMWPKGFSKFEFPLMLFAASRRITAPVG
jgi:putative oxidoreductase